MAKTLYAVIDVGSNSVRLMLSDGVSTLSKECTITKLAEGQGEDSMLCAQAIERTALAVSFYYNRAVSLGATKVFAFGTAALRKACNKAVFLDAVYNLCGLKVCVVSGEDEAGKWGTIFPMILGQNKRYGKNIICCNRRGV